MTLPPGSIQRTEPIPSAVINPPEPPDQYSMDRPTPRDELKISLMDLFWKNGSAGELTIENFLKEKLSGIPRAEQKAIILELIQEFGKVAPPDKNTMDYNGKVQVDDIMLSRVCSLLLGRDFSQENLTADELLEKFAKSLNTVFDALNQLINTINTTLAGNQNSDQTIRQVIGYHLGGDENAVSLDTHIGQIARAFLATQEAFKKAAQAKVEQIIEELAPERIEQDAGVTRLNPLRKSKCYEAYEAKFARFKKMGRIRWIHGFLFKRG